jgi:two-component system, sensor histidine kinase and response regulator
MTKKIMIVDDELHMLALMELLFQRRGFKVIKAHAAEDALLMLDAMTPDLFILDVMMPDMDGIELCQKIRERPGMATVPIIIFSARNDAETIKRSMAAGASLYLSKATRSVDVLAQARGLMGE